MITLNEQTKKQVFNNLNKIHLEKQQQLNILKTSQNFINSLDKESKETENIITTLFNERNQKITDLNEQLQQAISQNDKESIIKITKLLGGLK